jgi:hypothetical protein
VRIGSRVQEVWAHAACGSVCARAVIARYPGSHLHFQVTEHHYQPDPAELPDPLAAALHNVTEARHALAALARHLYHGGPSADTWWRTARADLATAVAALADLPEPDDAARFAEWRIRICAGTDATGAPVRAIEGYHAQAGCVLTPERAAVSFTEQACGRTDAELLTALATSFPGAEVTVEHDPFPEPDPDHVLMILPAAAAPAEH